MADITAKELAIQLAPGLGTILMRPRFSKVVEAMGHFGFSAAYPNGQRFEIVVRELERRSPDPATGGETP
jgi:hypothetical protein